MNADERIAALEAKVALLEALAGTTHIAQPRAGAPVFGGDTREIMDGEERPLFPLHSECGCGLPVVKMNGETPWLHC